MTFSRRGLLGGLGLILAAPMIVRAGILMPIKPPTEIELWQRHAIVPATAIFDIGGEQVAYWTGSESTMPKGILPSGVSFVKIEPPGFEPHHIVPMDPGNIWTISRQNSGGMERIESIHFNHAPHRRV